MGFISALLSGGSDDRPAEERRVDVLQHKAYRAAGNATARKLSDSDPLVHDMLNEAIIDAEKNVSWWRR